MPVALVEALLAHELAHVRRWDYLANLLQRLIEALLFFHPVIWWLSTRMRTEREQVADELAAEVLNDPSHLALALHELSLHPRLPQPGLILSGRGGFLLKRIERLLAPPSETASWKMALPALLVACTSLSIQSPAQNPTHNVSATSLSQLPVNAKHMLILDEDSGKILMAKDANTVAPIASLAKLMTAMVVLDAKLNPNEKLRVASEDLDSATQDSALLTTGSQVPRATALRMALMSSENRAAAMLARTYPGGGDAFAQAMQAKIHSLGLSHTTITEPTGAAPSNTSTATELAMVVAAAARYPEIAEFTSNKQTKIAVNDLIYELHNTNPLVGDEGWNIRLSKTGSSIAAGRCLTMRMRSHDKNITVVLLHAENSEQRSLDVGRIRDFLDNAG
jgi:D-alanyl-D-alanine endopeptidase (penicillin-binding protein 7)